MKYTLNANGRLLVINQPIVMGIINASSNSFYKQSGSLDIVKQMKTAESLLDAGATILDIGGMTTKPGSDEVSLEMEWNRVASLIREVRKEFPDVFLSVDTYRAEIAKRSAFEGIDIINDISAGDGDEEMLKTVSRLNLPFIAMHMQGKPKTMQVNPIYEDVVQNIISYFLDKLRQYEEFGIKDVIIDPGFGFGKDLLQNYTLLKGLHQFQILGKPVLAGLSRKSMIYQPLSLSPESALNGTTALHMVALQQGAIILRVHDVKEAMECIELWKMIS